MTFFSLRASLLSRLMLPLLAGMFAMAIARTSPQAAESKPQVNNMVYVMPADDGYGITECLALGGSCARIVADAWCESHGHARAISFGKAEDVTASIDKASIRAPEKDSYIITCAE